VNDQALTPTRILETAEDVLRRYGPTKATVVDVARALAAVAAEDGPAPELLRRWLDLLVTAKRRMAREDPELLATYVQLAADAREVVRTHADDLAGQLARIIADGVARGELTAADPATAGQAVFDATARFHNPTHAPEWSDPGIDAAYEGVRSLVLLGLGVQVADRDS
jgi:AcrR family transcriptional regulator